MGTAPKPKKTVRKTPAPSKPVKEALSKRMLQVANDMVAFNMLISHLLRPIAGEPLAEGASLDEMSERLRAIQNNLETVLAHHPVMTQKITEAYTRVETLWKAHQTTPQEDPNFQKIQNEAKEESQRAKETCAAMSDLVAALRCIT